MEEGGDSGCSNVTNLSFYSDLDARFGVNTIVNGRFNEEYSTSCHCLYGDCLHTLTFNCSTGQQQFKRPLSHVMNLGVGIPKKMFTMTF